MNYASWILWLTSNIWDVESHEIWNCIKFGKINDSSEKYDLKKMIAIYLKATEVLMKIHESAKYKWQTAWY